MRPPELFRTSRLVLRRPKAGDAEAIFAAYAQDPEVTRYLLWPPHRDVEDTRAYLAHCLENWRASCSWTYVIALDGGSPMGALDLRPNSPHRQGVTFGYVLRKSCWGFGYMSEALATMVDWSLAQEEVYRVWAFCDAENRASARVMEKAGLRFEGVLRRWSIHPNISPLPRDCLCYARVR